MTRAQRIERVVAGVIAQAMRDAHASHCVVHGAGADAALLREWCNGVLGDVGLVLDPVNKTSLLLGDVPQADVLPLGDLYASQVIELAGDAALSSTSAELAAVCGGTDLLDLALERFFDQRMDWPAATSQLSAHARDRLKHALEAARFRRARVPLVPKLGSRTLGIDLFA